jgi:hypothetical protein
MRAKIKYCEKIPAGPLSPGRWPPGHGAAHLFDRLEPGVGLPGVRPGPGPSLDQLVPPSPEPGPQELERRPRRRRRPTILPRLTWEWPVLRPQLTSFSEARQLEP